VKDEIEEIVRRFLKDLKEKESNLLHELEEYSLSEQRNLQKLKEDLDSEAETITSNCDVIEKHVLEVQENWTDTELVECKDIFQKTLDFLRNFDADTSDYLRRIRFIHGVDIDQVRKSLIAFGDLRLTQAEVDVHNILSPTVSQSVSSHSIPNTLGVNANVLMRSQSDHRLAAQFARSERRPRNRYLDVAAVQRLLIRTNDRHRH